MLDDVKRNNLDSENETLITTLKNFLPIRHFDNFLSVASSKVSEPFEERTDLWKM